MGLFLCFVCFLFSAFYHVCWGISLFTLPQFVSVVFVRGISLTPFSYKFVCCPDVLKALCSFFKLDHYSRHLTSISLEFDTEATGDEEGPCSEQGRHSCIDMNTTR